MPWFMSIYKQCGTLNGINVALNASKEWMHHVAVLQFILKADNVLV